MIEKYNQTAMTARKVSLSDKISFRIMSLIHEDLYRVFRDPYEALEAAGLTSSQTVLEVGCGPGFFTLPAAQMVGGQGRVYALDINPLAVEKVRRKVEEAGVTNVETVLADAAETGLPDETFDLIFLFGFARPIGGAEPIMVELQRLLKPEGTLAIEGRLRPPADLFRLVKREGSVAQYKKTNANGNSPLAVK